MSKKVITPKTVKDKRANDKKESTRAKAVALEVMDNVRKGKDFKWKDVQMKHGYTYYSANSMKVKQTDTFQRTINPFLKKMESVRDKVISALDNKDMAIEETRDLNQLLKTLNHDIQLLSGNATENVAVKPVMDMDIQEKLQLAQQGT